MLVILVIVVNTTYLVFRYQTPTGWGDYWVFQNGQFTIMDIKPGSPVDKAGVQIGDVLLSINSVPFTENYNLYHTHKAGDTLSYCVLRNGKELTIPVVLVSYLTEIPGYFQSMYVFILLLSIGSFYIFYKKPKDKAARIFFIYLQLFAIMQNAKHLYFQDPTATVANVIFIIGGCLSVSALIHFHLLFPRPSSIYSRNKWLTFFFYLTGLGVAIPYSIAYSLRIYFPSSENTNIFELSDRIGVTWMTLAFIIAFGIAVYQYIKIKDSLARNQLRVVVLGSLFGLLTPMTVAIFYAFSIPWENIFPFGVDASQGIGSLIMIVCLLIAIFRYRIWNTEIFIRRALLYMSATLVITLSYLLLIFFFERMTIGESNLARFIILAFSVIVFLALRDRIQHLIDRLFHRENYDSATVVTDFEEKLAGIYHLEELKSGIAHGLDEIFHFKSMVFNLKKDELLYEPVYSLGLDQIKLDKEYTVTVELEKKLKKSQVFAPAEIDQNLSIFEIAHGELIVPILKENQPFGFFLCGQKKSERTYSMQDIRVLSLIAKRVISLFHTAHLYQQDLDRQLMLERERARISQDMHDDIGAGLTKIAMISEAGAGEQGTGSSERMIKVATTSREMINSLNVIVWALNPRYDNLDSLISYARRYFGEFLENFGIRFSMEVPEEIPDLPVTPDFRRNAFYAWQEAIHNAVKHGDCSGIKMDVKIEGQALLVTISDNGKGFDQVRPDSGGNGLLNMKKRAEELGGSFEIQSELGKGTRVAFAMPVK